MVSPTLQGLRQDQANPTTITLLTEYKKYYATATHTTAITTQILQRSPMSTPHNAQTATPDNTPNIKWPNRPDYREGAHCHCTLTRNEYLCRAHCAATLRIATKYSSCMRPTKLPHRVDVCGSRLGASSLQAQASASLTLSACSKASNSGSFLAFFAGWGANFAIAARRSSDDGADVSLP